MLSGGSSSMLPSTCLWKGSSVTKHVFCFSSPFFFRVPSSKLASLSSSPNPLLHFCPELKNSGEKSRKYKTSKTIAWRSWFLSLLLRLVFSCLEAVGLTWPKATGRATARPKDPGHLKHQPAPWCPSRSAGETQQAEVKPCRQPST